ncbi:MAG: serine/threonine-protein kinase [Mycetocola sp.]
MPRRSVSTPPEIPGHSFIRLLGSGGFSDVYLYQQELPRREVAVKVLTADGLSESGRQAFIAEANLMAQLSAHPYIVTIYTADVATDGRPYIVMEYISGPTLAQQYRNGPLSVADTLRTGIRLSSAVATAHAAGILHRDIKPANVLSTDYGWPALTDFGISSAFEDGQGRDSDAVGMSIPWSPAEMFDDNPHPDVRSDVFSLAATVYTVLAARTPFERDGGPNGSVDVISRIERGLVEPLGRADVPSTLLAVLSRGLSRRPEDRFSGAVEFSRALQRIELELDYVTTPIDVPQVVLERSVQREDGRPAADAAPTRVRAPHPVVVDPEDGQDSDRTVIRGAVPRGSDGVAPRPGSDQQPGGADAGEGQGAEAEPGVRSRGHRLAFAGVLVLAVSATLTAAMVWGATSEDTVPEVEPSAQVTPIAAVPEAQAGDIQPSADKTSVSFSWRNPDQREGDRYLVRGTEGSGVLSDPQLLSAPTLTLHEVNPEGELCLQIQINRSGRLSAEPLIMCR